MVGFSKNEINETEALIRENERLAMYVKEIVRLIGQPRAEVKDILNARVSDFELPLDTGMDIAKQLSTGLGFRVNRWDRIRDIAKQFEAITLSGG